MILKAGLITAALSLLGGASSAAMVYDAAVGGNEGARSVSIGAAPSRGNLFLFGSNDRGSLNSEWYPPGGPVRLSLLEPD